MIDHEPLTPDELRKEDIARGLDQRCFPVLLGGLAQKYPDCPRWIPWAIIEPHRKRAEENHCRQTLERLAERGGLDPRELRCVLEDRAFKTEFGGAFEEEKIGEQKMRGAVDLLKKLVEGNLRDDRR